MSAFDLTDRVALVTGASNGIGRAVARVLGGAGARVLMCGRSAEAEAAVAEVPGEALYLSCDVTDRDAVQRTVDEAITRFGGLHILVNNAGIAIDNLLLRTKPEQWDEVINVNLTGAFNFCKAAARHLLKAKASGRIVNISSVVGERGNVGQAAYAAAKAGMLGLTKSLAAEFGPRGVTVNAVSPGFIETRMTQAHVSDEHREGLLAHIPLGEMGQVDDVAYAVQFLCSDAARYITGEVLRVNGGLYM